MCVEKAGLIAVLTVFEQRIRLTDNEFVKGSVMNGEDSWPQCSTVPRVLEIHVQFLVTSTRMMAYFTKSTHAQNSPPKCTFVYILCNFSGTD